MFINTVSPLPLEILPVPIPRILGLNVSTHASKDIDLQVERRQGSVHLPGDYANWSGTHPACIRKSRIFYLSQQIVSWIGLVLCQIEWSPKLYWFLDIRSSCFPIVLQSKIHLTTFPYSSHSLSVAYSRHSMAMCRAPTLKTLVPTVPSIALVDISL